MAYVVARPAGRFEIRESVQTPKGPRARSLANFSVLTGDVLAKAAGRATRPFAAEAVRAAAERSGAPWADQAHPARTGPGPGPGPGAIAMRRFVASSRRMARSLEPHRGAARRDPGDALIDLLGFVAQIGAFREAGPLEPLRFPPLHRLRAERLARAAGE